MGCVQANWGGVRGLLEVLLTTVAEKARGEEGVRWIKAYHEAYTQAWDQ